MIAIYLTIVIYLTDKAFLVGNFFRSGLGQPPPKPQHAQTQQGRAQEGQAQ